MVGSFLYNCWAAVIAFTIYFFMTFQTFKTPARIITNAFVVAVIVFLLTYMVRFIIAFVTDNPPEETLQGDTEKMVQSENATEENSVNVKNSEEFSEGQAKELAKAVKTMMSND